ncbi:hypothetical protein AB6A40_001072 [Gnathostoma spinigerum]|uniref:RYYR-CCHC domain-containing protein n=1 Tax=Gnathostoma spinigerum TaxID=75299 RepID=A0ABD6E3C7_9BILA
MQSRTHCSGQPISRSAAMVAEKRMCKLQKVVCVRGRRTSIAIETDEGVRIYRQKSTYGNAIYYVCSRCEYLNRSRSLQRLPKIRTVDGVIVGPRSPLHHDDCKPTSREKMRARQIDLECRMCIRNGVVDARQGWVMGHSIAQREDESRAEQDGKTEEISTYFPSWKAARKVYVKQDSRLRVPITRQYDLPSQYCVTLPSPVTDNSERWLLDRDEANGLLVFASDSDITVAADSDVIIGDRTFAATPKGFVQMFTVHGRIFVGNTYEWVPVLFALMQKRTYEAYCRILGAMVKKWNELGLKPLFTIFQTDFEADLMEAVSTTFGEQKVGGCMFHFIQAILRQTVRFGLGRVYRKEPIIRRWVRRIIGLALLPPGHAIVLWHAFLCRPPSPPSHWVGSAETLEWPMKALEQFSEYITSYWFEMPVLRWNSFMKETRTANVADVFHKSLRRRWRVTTRPSLSTFLGLLQTRQSEVSTYVKQLKSGQLPKHFDRKYHQLNGRLQIQMMNYSQRLVKKTPGRFSEFVDVALPYLDAVEKILSRALNGRKNVKEEFLGPNV